MSADLWAVILIALTAPPITLFAIGYGATMPWWRSWEGRALFVSSAGLAALVDISLAYQWLGDDYALRDVVRLTVYSLVCAGAWLKFGLLVKIKVSRYRALRRGES